MGDFTDNCDTVATDETPHNGKMKNTQDNGSAVSIVESDICDRDTRCGYGKCTPDCLQKSANPKALLAVICYFVFIQSFAVLGINNVNTTTMERRFDLSSEQVAWITSAYDIAGGVLAVVLGYLGSRLYKGRILTFCAMVMGIGSFLMFLPHFLIDPYEQGQAESDFCDVNGTDTCASQGSTSLSNWLPMFISAQLLHAVGGSAAYTLALPYLDENLKAVDTPLYVGIFQAFSALGPAVGFIGGGALLNIYVDIDKVDMDDITITPDDPRWCGAWWIGFIIASFGGLSIAVFMGCFPRELPVARRLRLEREARAARLERLRREEEVLALSKKSDDMERRKDEKVEEKEIGKWKEMGISLKTFFTTPSYVLMTLGGIVESGAVVGFATFLPKVIQFQFAQSPSQAAFLAGVLTVPGAAGGQLLGGAIPKWLKLKPRGLLMQTFICAVCGFVLSFCFLMRCDMANMAGINVPYFNESNFDLIHPCNENCTCNTESYSPLCYGGIEYFSPCHAGCLSAIETEDTWLYTNCSCINTANGSQNVPPTEWHSGWGVADSCEIDCSLLIPYLILFFFLMLVTFISNTSGQTGTIRTVPYKDRSFAFGVQWTLIRFLGNVPGPIIMGKIFDGACWLWQEKCDTRGSCWIYNNADLSIGLCVACLVVKGFSSICFGLATLFFKEADPGNISISMEGSSSDTSSVKSLESSSTSNRSDDDDEAIPNEKPGGLSNAGFVPDSSFFGADQGSTVKTPDVEYQTRL